MQRDLPVLEAAQEAHQRPQGSAPERGEVDQGRIGIAQRLHACAGLRRLVPRRRQDIDRGVIEATRLLEPGVGEKDFSLFFTDATTGKESYGLGRYLEAEPRPDGRYVLDFNRCYDPACAYSEHYNCPIPPRTNHLKVAVRAGEKDSHYLDHGAGH